ncbi:hypothetical protein AB0E04_38155 [Streptomyces sp. NPDC048251]|uniref:hypothetical protein n=1 Tax=Streptomyces sp. NPDC048251 TaxID=3154501 RepID=UPI00342D3BA0
MTKAVHDAVGGERAPIYQRAWSCTGRRRIRLAGQALFADGYLIFAGCRSAALGPSRNQCRP